MSVSEAAREFGEALRSLPPHVQRSMMRSTGLSPDDCESRLTRHTPDQAIEHLRKALLDSGLRL